MHPSRGLSTAEECLRSVFGHPGFRTAQRPIVAALLAGRDVLAVLPTGSGKSACFQVPALLSARPTLVVSPLISLMQDQVAALCRRGVKAGEVSSAASPDERRATLRALAGGRLRLVYASPERLASPAFREAAGSVPFERIVVDEAHCIVEWGHDFRPDYLRIADFVTGLATRTARRPSVAAFTATAPPAARAEIIRRLRMTRPARFVASSDRPNLHWSVELAASAPSGVRRAVRAARGSRGAALIYVRSRWNAVRLAEAARSAGLAAAPYHAGLPAHVRGAIQQRFLAGRYRVLCATSAFGMGIDHPKVRLVCHVAAPGSIEAYVQEAGRAGRDGEPSRCHLISLPDDFVWQRQRIRDRLKSGQRRHALARLTAMRRYVRAGECRRAVIAAYFEESPPLCAGCDVCDRRPEPEPSGSQATRFDCHASTV